MTARLPHTILCLIAAGMPLLAGCNSSSDSDDLADDPVPTAPALPVAAIGAPAREGKLTLNLKVGDRFPLLKTVEHSLQQPTPQGVTTIKGSLELLMSVTVEEIRPAEAGKSAAGASSTDSGLKRMEVKYHRVRFAQEFPDGAGSVRYDSDAPPRPPARIPVAALGYHGLKDNSFQFWLGPDNQIVQIIEFDKFLARCLASVPSHDWVKVRGHLAATSGADGIANFIDDSIGILPTHAVRVNTTWSRDRTIPQPVPMHISSRYTLRQLTADTADVDIFGVITPSTTYGPPDQPNKGVQVFVTGGNCYGSCQIDRRTGLPIQSRVEQAMTMSVRLPGGIDFQQQKSTLITIRAFPGQTAQEIGKLK